jgi:superfamily II DNA helicase RecQ
MFAERFPKLPLLLLTATATKAVQKDILESLQIEKALILRSSYDRPNLRLIVERKDHLKTALSTEQHIAQFIKRNHANQAGLIYCLTTKDCEEVSEELKVAIFLTKILTVIFRTLESIVISIMQN